MPSNHNKLTQFWQRLKRRNVTRVLAVYVAAAFMILELVDMTSEPFGLPDWSMNVAFFILIAGLVIALIISWVYDIQPEGGIVKTEPAQKVKTGEELQGSNSWKIASYISFVVIVGLIVLNIIPRTNNNKILEKSIAVLPLEYLSEDPNKQYLANGVLDAITGHLSLIEGLRVMPRTSVEQYRENKKSAKEIGEDLDVSYLIEGSFLMIEDQVKLTIQLVVAEEGDHVFFREYNINYIDILTVQSEVVKTIANEIEVAISPEEKQLIEKVPTTSLTAHDYYQQGREEFWSGILNLDYSSLDRAETLFRYALDYDSTYALAYTSLAQVYGNRPFLGSTLVGSRLFEEYLDSVLILANKALSIDDELSEAYALRGWYFKVSGKPDQAILDYEKAIQYNPNDPIAYSSLGDFYSDTDLVKSLENYHKAYALGKGPSLPFLLRGISYVYAKSGFREKAAYFVQEAINMDQDTLSYLTTLSFIERTFGNFTSVKELYLRIHAIDTSKLDIVFRIGDVCLFLEQYETAWQIKAK